MDKDPTEMTIKEFMEWYVSEYDDNALLPEDFSFTIARLEGYTVAKSNTEDYYILYRSLKALQTSRNFFEVVKRYAKWQYKV